MLVGRLIGLIEDHAAALADRLVRKIREDSRTASYESLDDDQLADRGRRVYAHLGRWLGETSETHVEEEYLRLGRERREEGIPLAEVVMSLLITRRNLWQFVDAQGADTILELRQQLDLELLVVRFFDRAIYHTVRGYQGDRPE